MNKTFSALLIFLLIGSSLRAQVNDAGLWTSFQVEKKVSQALSVQLNQEFRLNENFCEMGDIFSDLGAEYKFNKNFRVSLNYRFSNKRNINDFYSKRHRFYSDLTWRKKEQKLIFVGRLRLQHQYKDIFSREEGLNAENYIRAKLQIKLDINKALTPYLYAETFSPIETSTYYLDKIRFSLGFDYELNNRNALDFFYLYQKELIVKNPVSDFVFGVGYKVVF